MERKKTRALACVVLLPTDMPEQTKELDQLRRLAEMLRQAWGAAGDGTQAPSKSAPVKKLRRGKPADAAPVSADPEAVGEQRSRWPRS